MLRIAYGYVTEDDNDPMVATATQALSAISTAAQPGRWLVDIFPSCALTCIQFPRTELLLIYPQLYICLAGFLELASKDKLRLGENM